MAVRLKDRIEANIRQSDKVNSSLSINGKSYNGSQAITVGTLGVEYGGTGATSFSTNYVLLGNAANAIKVENIHLNYTTGTAETNGYEELVIGNKTASGTAGNRFGRLAVYSTSTGGAYITSAATSSWPNHILPTTGGTILNTGTTTWTAADPATAKVGTLKLNGSNKVLYDVFLYQRGANFTDNSITDLNTVKTPGVYYSNNSTETGTLTNAPPGIASGFRLITLVGYQGTSNYGHQLAFSSDRILWRKMGASNGAPSSWYGFIPFVAGTAVGSANQPIYLTDKGTPTPCNTFVPNTGGTFSGPITISHATSATMDHTTTNPRIVFAENGSQAVGLVYTDYDSYRHPAGLKIIDMSGDNGDPWFEVPGAIYASGGKTVLHTGNYNSYAVSLSGNQTIAGTKTFTGDIKLSRSTTIADNTPARLQFSVTQTDNSVTSTGYIACYDDLDANGYGVNMVINATSGVYISAGEGAGSYLSTNPSTGENVHLCADSAIYFHANCNTVANATTTCYISTAGVLYGACWNDYAEYRAQNKPLIAGHITYCDDDGKLKYTTERLQKFEGVVSDTFGFAIGETDECKTPLAVSGRALVYCDPEDHFHSGDCVCAGPDGKAYRMTREEIAMYPDRIVGVVSEIPTYERWGSGDVKVDGRIWIKVR